MLKKVITFVVLTLLLLLSYQWIINFLKTEHDVEYVIQKEEDYLVREKYRKKNNDDYYVLEVETKDSYFIVDEDNSFNKQKKVVKDIKKYEKEGLTCLSFIYINGKASVPVCTKDGGLTSYLMWEKEDGVKDFLSSLPEFSSHLWKGTSKQQEFLDLTIYQDYQYDFETFLVYNYKNMIRLTKTKNDILTFGSFDVYKNELGRLIGKYYVIPKSTNSPEYNRYLAFDVTGNVIKEIKLENGISKNMYINGIYNDKLYFFDKSDLIQYTLEPKAEKVEIVGTKDKKGFFYRDGKEEKISVYDLNNQVLKFSDGQEDYPEIVCDEMFVGDRYAIYRNGTNFYKVYKENLDKPILLFQESGIEEIKLVNNRLYYMKGDTLYRYDNYGKVPLLKREEFKYNHLNIYDIYISD